MFPPKEVLESAPILDEENQILVDGLIEPKEKTKPPVEQVPKGKSEK